MNNKIKTVLNQVLDTFFPPVCLSCKSVGGGLICTTCWQSRPALNLIRHKVPWIDAYSFLLFSGMQKKLLLALKYDGQVELETVFYDWLNTDKHGHLFTYADFFVPIPLHPSRLKKRGFNQVDMVFKKWVEHKLGKRYLAGAVRRKINTPALFDLSKEERGTVLDAAFELTGEHPGLAGKTVVILDDIFTSGQTMKQVAELFRAKGAVVQGLTFCYADDTPT